MEGRYALWIEPPGYLAVRFDALIEALAASHGGPRFRSHITLLGGIEGREPELMRCARSLAARLRPFDLRLDGLGMEDEYFRALYLRAEKAGGLIEARRLAEEEFAPYIDDGSRHGYGPHMSLWYGDLEAARKEDIIRGMGGGLGALFRVDGISLYRTGGAPHEWARAGETIVF